MSSTYFAYLNLGDMRSINLFSYFQMTWTKPRPLSRPHWLGGQTTGLTSWSSGSPPLIWWRGIGSPFLGLTQRAPPSSMSPLDSLTWKVVNLFDHSRWVHSIYSFITNRDDYNEFHMIFRQFEKREYTQKDNILKFHVRSDLFFYLSFEGSKIELNLDSFQCYTWVKCGEV